MRIHLKEIFDYQDMIYSLVRRDLRGKYKGSILGFLWTFINPLCQMIVYTIVFSVIVQTDLEQFYVYMITGMVPWLFFDMSLRQGTGCVRYQGEMVKKIYFPREVLPVACVTSNFVNMLFCFLIVFFVCIVSGAGLRLAVLVWLLPVMLIEYLLTVGFVLLVAAGTVYLKDLEHIITVILMAWIYLTPIMYPLHMIPDRILWIFLINPITPVIEAYHAILYWKKAPDLSELAYAFLFGIVLLVISEVVFMKLSDNFAEEL